MRSMATWLSLLIPAVAGAVDVEGTVQYGRTASLSVPVSGVVAEVNTEPGATVTHGELLLALDDTPFRAEVTQAEAALARATADRIEAERDHRQARELYERTVLSTVELENAKLKHDRALAAHKAAQAQLLQARYHLRRSRIVAPFDADVIDVRVQPGETVLHALDAKPLIVLGVPGDYLVRLRGDAKAGSGQRAQVIVGDQRYEARLVATPHGEAGTNLTARFKAPSAAVRVGQRVHVRLP